tara:strand:+ start:506 stop:724 length:219 start_codon:yes stop_codon:yes gene_type:complete
MDVETTKLTTLITGLIGLIVLPLGFIWAINTAFALNIQYTFLNWLSIVFLQLYFQIVVRASTSNGKKVNKNN